EQKRAAAAAISADNAAVATARKERERALDELADLQGQIDALRAQLVATPAPPETPATPTQP
ncbi:MAG: hypothetical protein ACK40I_03315, partial [Tabrizicola sp.]